MSYPDVLKLLGYLLSNLVALDVVVYPCQYAQRKNLGQHPSGRIRVRISVAEMLNEVLTRLCQFNIEKLLCLREGAGIIEACRVGHPARDGTAQRHPHSHYQPDGEFVDTILSGSQVTLEKLQTYCREELSFSHKGTHRIGFV